MNKSQSETKFQSSMQPRPNVERRHHSQGGASHSTARQSLFHKGKGSRGKQRKVMDEVFEETRRKSKKDGESYICNTALILVTVL